jgi:N-acetylglucosamine-6-phosphate deacetylase
MEKQVMAVVASRVITPLEELQPGVVLVAGGKIMAVGRAGNVTIPAGAEVVDVGPHTIAPGFVDLHIHGALGKLAGESAASALSIARYLPSTGTTSWLPTVSGLQSIGHVVEAMKTQQEGASIAGIHMEGPYLAPKELPHEGQVAPPVPTVAELEGLLAAGSGSIRLMGIAPELGNSHAVIAAMRRAGVVPAVAHSKADYDTFMRAVEVGVRHATHAYNVMTGMHHRRPGIVGGVLTCDQITAELIADGYHVHPVAMEVLIRCKGPARVALITDSSRYQGLPDGDYGRVTKKDGIVRQKGYDSTVDHTMAGSVWPLNKGVANVVRLVGMRLRDAVRMASLTPALIAGLAATKGSIEPGKDADLIAIDESIEVHWAMVGGKEVPLAAVASD